MRTSKAKARNKVLVTILAAVSLVLGSAGSASAQVPDPTVGTGGGTGWEYPDEAVQCTPPAEFPLAATIDFDRFELSHYGTYTSAPATNPPGVLPVASYLGPTDVTIEVGPHTISPIGTHPGGCPPFLPPPVPGFVTIEEAEVHGSTGSEPNSGSVDCQMVEGTGTYIRVSSAVVFTFESTCTITGNVILGTVTNVPVTHVIEGTMNPCVFPFIFFPPPVGNEDGVTNPECDAIEDPEAGGAGSHLVTTYEAAGVAP